MFEFERFQGTKLIVPTGLIPRKYIAWGDINLPERTSNGSSEAQPQSTRTTVRAVIVRPFAECLQPRRQVSFRTSHADLLPFRVADL